MFVEYGVNTMVWLVIISSVLEQTGGNVGDRSEMFGILFPLAISLLQRFDCREVNVCYVQGQTGINEERPAIVFVRTTL